MIVVTSRDIAENNQLEHARNLLNQVNKNTVEELISQHKNAWLKRLGNSRCGYYR